MDQDVLINAMVELAALEAERSGARAGLERCRKRLQSLEELQQECEADVRDAGGGALRLEASLHNRELEIQALEQTIARKKAQFEKLGDDRLREALGREIEALETRCDLMLEEACEILGRSQEQVAAAETARLERDAVDRGRRSETEDLDGLRERSAAALQEIEAEIQRLVVLLPEQESRHLQRLWSRQQTAVVPVEQGACGGCFVQLPPQLAASAGQGKALVRCPSCMRYVVHKPWR